jgi:hypothetical protein
MSVSDTNSKQTRKLSIADTLWACAQAGFGLLFIAVRVLEIPDAGFERLPLVFMGVPHLIVAAGIGCRRRWSLWLGLAHSMFLPLTVPLAIAVLNMVVPVSESSGLGPAGPEMGTRASTTFLIGIILLCGYWPLNIAMFLTLLLFPEPATKKLGSRNQVTGPSEPHRFGVLASVSLSICLLALIVECILTVLSTNNPWALGLGDLAILLYMLGPYPALAVIAWISRSRWALAWATLTVTLILATWGLCATGTHTYHYLTDLEFRKLQPIGIFLMPLGQWFAVGCLGLVVTLRGFNAPKASP